MLTWLHFGSQNPSKSYVGGVLKRLGGVLERPERFLARLGSVLERLETSWGILERSWSGLVAVKLRHPSSGG